MLWLHSSKLDSFWWLEVQTTEPQGTYYFGPFDSALEAAEHQADYVKDLVAERAQGLTITIQQCQPTTLTIFDDQSSSESL
jgi:hypothetical protein